MNILLVLIPVTLLVVLIAVAAFFWAVNQQQFEDLDSPAMLPLLDDATTETTATQESGAAASRTISAGENPD